MAGRRISRAVGNSTGRTSSDSGIVRISCVRVSVALKHVLVSLVMWVISVVLIVVTSQLRRGYTSTHSSPDTLVRTMAVSGFGVNRWVCAPLAVRSMCTVSIVVLVTESLRRRIVVLSAIEVVPIAVEFVTVTVYACLGRLTVLHEAKIGVLRRRLVRKVVAPRAGAVVVISSTVSRDIVMPSASIVVSVGSVVAIEVIVPRTDVDVPPASIVIIAVFPVASEWLVVSDRLWLTSARRVNVLSPSQMKTSMNVRFSGQSGWSLWSLMICVVSGYGAKSFSPILRSRPMPFIPSDQQGYPI